jgi:predicted enzyme related to lactoylglutathione lyase
MSDTPPPYRHGQFNWVDLNAHDKDAAVSFYSDLFGWSVRDADTGPDGPPYGLFFLGDEAVAGVGQMSDEMKTQGVPPMWNSYINVEGIEDVVAAAERLGASIVAPVMQVMDAGKMAFITDPSGGTVAFWEAGSHVGAGIVNQPDTFCWNELATRDVDAAMDFFGDLLGWEFQENPHAPSVYYIVKLKGRNNGGILQMTDEWGDISPHWMTYFAVADVDSSAQKLKDLGGTVHHAPFDTAAGRLAVVSDAQGAMFHMITLTDTMD